MKWEKAEQWALLNYVLSFANCLPFAKTVRPRFVALAMAMAAIKANLINFSLSLPFSLSFLLLPPCCVRLSAAAGGKVLIQSTTK